MTLRRVELILVFLSFWILAVVLPTIYFAPARWGALRFERIEEQASPEAELFLEIIGIIFLLGVLLLVFLVVISLWRRRRKKKEENFIYKENPPLSWPIYVTAIFLFMGFGGLIWLASQQSDRLERLLGPRRTPEIREIQKEHSAVSKPLESQTERPEMVKESSPRWIVFLILGVASFLGMLCWQILRIRPFKGGLDSSQVIEVVSNAVKELQEQKELSDVVLRCYRDMCKILSRKVALRRDLTPREFRGLLVQAGVQEREVTGLTDLFERVRYGRRLSGATEAAEALAFLKSIEKKYARSEDET